MKAELKKETQVIEKVITEEVVTGAKVVLELNLEEAALLTLLCAGMAGYTTGSYRDVTDTLWLKLTALSNYNYVTSAYNVLLRDKSTQDVKDIGYISIKIKDEYKTTLQYLEEAAGVRKN